MKLNEIWIRDPFILKDDKYYLYGTTSIRSQSFGKQSFDVYVSDDLDEWSGPTQVFESSKEFWGTKEFWAPEVYAYNKYYYMFATFNSKKRKRGVQVLVSDSPLGPFVPHGEPITPEDWLCLDGTLFIENNTPYMVFCKEWLMTRDGEMWLVELSEDLAKPVGEPVKLFSASEAKWSKPFRYLLKKGNYITDGPYLHRHGSDLYMLWSTNGDKGYCMGLAKSKTGSVYGPWVQLDEPVIKNNGGHGMLFNHNKELYLTYHYPNTHRHERPYFKKVDFDHLA